MLDVGIQETEEPGRGPKIERQSGSRRWIVSLMACSRSKNSAMGDCEWILGKERGFETFGFAFAKGLTEFEG